MKLFVIVTKYQNAEIPMYVARWINMPQGIVMLASNISTFPTFPLLSIPSLLT
jgi:hypothetical protein